jgi:hypothetical protein
MQIMNNNVFGQILLFWQKIMKFLEIVNSTNFTNFLEKFAKFFISLNWKIKTPQSWIFIYYNI